MKQLCDPSASHMRNINSNILIVGITIFNVS